MKVVIVLHRESRTEAKTDSYSNDRIFQKLSMFAENLALLSGEFSARQAQREVVKIKKSGFFLLGLKYTLRTCFESKNFLPKFCSELSNQILSFSVCQIYYIVVSSSCTAISFQLFDI